MLCWSLKVRLILGPFLAKKPKNDKNRPKIGKKHGYCHIFKIMQTLQFLSLEAAIVLLWKPKVGTFQPCPAHIPCKLGRFATEQKRRPEMAFSAIFGWKVPKMAPNRKILKISKFCRLFSFHRWKLLLCCFESLKSVLFNHALPTYRAN